MAKKTWIGYAETRKPYPGVWEKVTTIDPRTSLNPERLAYLKAEAEKVGLLTDIRPVREGRAPRVMWVAWPE